MNGLVIRVETTCQDRLSLFAELLPVQAPIRLRIRLRTSQRQWRIAASFRRCRIFRPQMGAVLLPAPVLLVGSVDGPAFAADHARFGDRHLYFLMWRAG